MVEEKVDILKATYIGSSERILILLQGRNTIRLDEKEITRVMKIFNEK